MVSTITVLNPIVYYKNRSNLALVILIHGFYDTVGLAPIYFNKERVFSEWILQMI